MLYDNIEILDLHSSKTLYDSLRILKSVISILEIFEKSITAPLKNVDNVEKMLYSQSKVTILDRMTLYFLTGIEGEIVTQTSSIAIIK